MANIASIYTNGLKKETDRFGVWKPGTKTELGDFGLIEHNSFIRLGNIAKNFGIEFVERPGTVDAGGKLAATGVKKTVVQFGNEAPDKSGFSGKITLTFDNEGSFYIDYLNRSVVQIEDQLQLSFDIHKLGNRWNPKWVVITEVERADSADIYISNQKHSEIELGIAGNVDVRSVNLAKADVDVKVIREVNVSCSNKFLQPLTLTFNASRMKTFATGLHPNHISLTINRSRFNTLSAGTRLSINPDHLSFNPSKAVFDTEMRSNRTEPIAKVGASSGSRLDSGSVSKPRLSINTHDRSFSPTKAGRKAKSVAIKPSKKHIITSVDQSHVDPRFAGLRFPILERMTVEEFNGQ